MSEKQPISVAVIGGSGLYGMKDLADVEEIKIETPFGDPSDAVIAGTLEGVRVAFLPRHGRGHRYLPGEIPQRANLWALKSLGVDRVVSVSAVGSLREDYAPRHFAFPDQLVDRTKGRVSTFFGDGIVGHVDFALPFYENLRKILYEEAQGLGITSHWGGTYCCMEGPQFSTKAESEMHRKLGFSLIGMTASPEAKLAREAGMAYAPVCLVTDYDVWKEGEEVSVDKVVETLNANIENAQKLLKASIRRIADLKVPEAIADACRFAVFTSPKAMPEKTYNRLELLIGKYVRPV